MEDRFPIIASGRTAEVAAFGEGRIVKLFKHGFPHTDAEREYETSDSLYRSGMPVARPYGLTEIGGRFGIVFERIDGDTMLARIGRDASLAIAEAERLAELHAEIHGADADGMPDAKAALLAKIAEAPLLDDDEKERIALALAELPDGDRLLHGDFHPDNVLVDADGRAVVLDWLTAASGHPAADVARTVVLFRCGALPDGMPEQAVRQFTAARSAMLAAYLDRYASLTGVDRSVVEAWTLPVCAARLVENIPDSEKESLLAAVRTVIRKMKEEQR